MAEENSTDVKDAMADDWASALEEQARDTPAKDSAADFDDVLFEGIGNKDSAEGKKAKSKAPRDSVEKAEFESLKRDPERHATQEDVNLEVVLDIPVTISMEIGRSKIPIRNLLQLNQGSVVELDRLAGEPLDVLVNGTLIAHGEVVVVNEKFGIRLTDVISPTERVKKLK